MPAASNVVEWVSGREGYIDREVRDAYDVISHCMAFAHTDRYVR